MTEETKRRNHVHPRELDESGEEVHAVPHILEGEGPLLPIIQTRLNWCAEHCVADYGFSFGHDSAHAIDDGPTFLFKDQNDAIAFKMRWFKGYPCA